MSDFDLTRLQSDINAEVRARRAAGDFPPAMERELDAMFARYAPAGTSDDFDEVMVQAETLSFVHADVPVGSRIGPLGLVKRGLRKLIGWYLRFIAQQVTAFAGTLTRAVRLLGERVDAVETVTVSGLRRDVRASVDLSEWTELVVRELKAATGRVLHTECGDGWLVSALVDAGVDAYGVEPLEMRAGSGAGASALDLRVDDALVHLRALPAGTLGGLVLSGCVDALPLGEVLALASRALEVVAAGGVLVVLSAGPGSALVGDRVVADLAPGRPLHAATWSHVLGQQGFTVVRVEESASAVGVLQHGVDSALNENIDRLNQLLFAPGYAVIARR